MNLQPHNLSSEEVTHYSFFPEVLDDLPSVVRRLNEHIEDLSRILLSYRKAVEESGDRVSVILWDMEGILQESGPSPENLRDIIKDLENLKDRLSAMDEVDDLALG